MGRPLPESQIVKMDLTVSTLDGSKKLGKQVGYNKYRTQENKDEIVMLVEELKNRGDALLILEDHGKDKPVTKIVENLFQTPEKPYAYILDADGKVVFLEEGISVYGTNPDVKNAEEAIEEIEQIPEGGTGGADVEGDATFSSTDSLEIDGNRTVTVNVNGELNGGTHSASVADGSALNLSGETVNLSTNAMNVQGEATLTINEGGSFGSEAIVVTGDNASATIQGGE